METMHDMTERHEQEKRDLVASCPHTDVLIEDGRTARDGSREITLRCVSCRWNLTTWGRGTDGRGEFFYVRGWKRELPADD